jgi:hypothetical protein
MHPSRLVRRSGVLSSTILPASLQELALLMISLISSAYSPRFPDSYKALSNHQPLGHRKHQPHQPGLAVQPAD